MNENFIKRLGKEIEGIKSDGLFKNERIITSGQGAEIQVGGKTMLNFCANNYLGLATHPKVIAASKLVDGMVANGYTYNENRERIYQREPGKVIEDATVAKALLPTREGCFFGLPEYDEWYLEEVVRTRAWAAQMLTDIKEGLVNGIFYSSSW